MKLGLKLWSINNDFYYHEAKTLYDKRIYDYIELYVVPDSISTLNSWSKLDIPFIIHAPHFAHGMNLAKKEFFENNLKLVKEVQCFADKLNAEYIIFHPGVEGTIEETVKQLNKINDKRIIIENKPYKAIPKMGGDFCTGASFDELSYVIKNANVGFCLDIGHSIAAANSFKEDPYEYIKKLISLKPTMYHLSDTNIQSEFDSHLNFGNGTLDVNKILDIMPLQSTVTIETVKNSQDNLDDFIEDVNYIKNML